jgi:uncharacterized protein YgiM (DUF1202 family)
MTVKALFVAGFVLLLGVAWPRAGEAEKVKANQSARVHSRAGEQSPVILKVKAGQGMTVVAEDGRWLKVRVSGRTGWVPRSKVDRASDDDEALARNTRRRPFVDGRSTRRGFGGQAGPEDRVGGDATGEGDEPEADDANASDDDGPARTAKRDDDDDDRPARTARRDDDDRPARTARRGSDERGSDDERSSRSGNDGDGDGGDGEDGDEPRRKARVSKRTAAYVDADKDSDEAFTIDPRSPLYVVGTKGSWALIQNDEGDEGWVPTSRLEIEEAFGPRRRSIDLRARLGVALLRRSISTEGGMAALPDNYGASSSSITIALGGSVLHPYSKRYWIGGELAYDYDNAVLGGISYQGRTTSFAFHNLNLRAMVGYDLQSPSGTIVLGRLGYHYDSFQVANVEDTTRNTAKLPSQILSGPTLGAALTMPRFSKTIGLRFSLDALLFGSNVKQTAGLEDGVGPSAKAFFLGGCLTYRWKPRVDLQATYDLAYALVRFAGPAPATSMRGHTPDTTSAGKDLNNTVSFGISYAM